MWTLRNIAGGVLSVLVLGGCAADPTNDPRSGGFFGGVRGLAAGDYDMRQQALQGQRDDSLNQLSALQEEGEALETERQMKASEVAAQRRQLAALKARNRELAGRINQLQRSKAATEQRTAELRRKQQRLTRGIQEFETQLDRGQLTAAQADSKRLSLERQYDAIKDL
jgi:chromosome segregation ATPase